MLERSVVRDAVFGIVLLGTLCVPQTIHAQNPDGRSYDPWQHTDPNARLQRLEPGTFVTVRTNQSIDTNRRDGHVFTAVVDQDVWDDYRRLAMPAIPRGSSVELIVRTARDGDLVLDLDSIAVGGQRYAVQATPDRVEAGQGVGNNRDTATKVGGGAILGSIIGAVVGGGKGAAIGAAAGAAVGAAVVTQGHQIHVPPGSTITFRLENELVLGVPDNGYSRDRDHYHRD
jgi:hypothetical protein